MGEEQDMGASFGPGSRASTEPASGLGPAGFDPSRWRDVPMWPFGHGVLTTCRGHADGIGALLICAVPDGHTLADGFTPNAAWEAAAAFDGPRTALTFCSADAARRLARELDDLASAMEAASAGETEGLDPKGDSAVGEAETPNPCSGNTGKAVAS